jgi:ligand-binding sensor domain-containing protein
VRAIAVDKADRKWFGTDGGVSCYDGRAWTSWTKNDHLAENGIRSLAVDIDGSIWVATEKGVSHIVLEKSE